MAHISRKAKAVVLTRLLAAAQQAPQRGQSRCFVQFQSSTDIGVIHAHELIHHFAIGGHSIPSEGDFSVLGGGEGGCGFHMIRILRILILYRVENQD